MRGQCDDGRSRSPSRDVYCQHPEWDKDLNRNFKATSVSSTPPPPSSQSLGCVMVNKLLLKCVRVCVCVILFGSLLFSDCYMHFLAAMRAVWISKCVFLPGCAFCLMRRCVRVRFKEQTAGCRYNWSRGSDSLLSPSELSAGSLWQGWK